MQQLRTIWSRYGRIGLGVVISLGSIVLASRNVDYSQVWSSLARANSLWVGLALLSVIVNTLGKVVRWQLLMGEDGQVVSFGQALRILLIGQLVNNVMPARIGDLSRAYLMGELGLRKSFVLGTIVVEKMVDMLMYALLFGLLLPLMTVPEWVSRPAYVFFLIAGASIVGMLLIVWFRQPLIGLFERLTARLPATFRPRLLRSLHAGLASLTILRDGATSFRITIWSLLVWITAVLTNYLVLGALDLPPSLVSSIFVLIVLQAGISLPSVPGRIGIFQYLCVLALAVFAIDATNALSYGVLLHAIVFLPPMLAGIIALYGPGPGWKRVVHANSE